jgi:hypothetical protein
MFGFGSRKKMTGWIVTSELDLNSLAPVTASARRDGQLQRSLAWCSYFTLVFVSLCMFQPATIASASGLISLPLAAETHLILDASLRPGDETGRLIYALNEWQLRPGT